MAFHWHDDMFDIPQGAYRCAASSACPHQAFSYDNDRVIGLQFHLELTHNGIHRLIDQCGNSLTASQYVQNKHEMIKDTYVSKTNINMKNILQTIKAKNNL